MDLLKGIKTGLSALANVGAGAIVGNIVCATMPAGTGLLMKAAIQVGAYGLSNLAGSMAGEQIEKEIDEVVGLINKNKETTKDEESGS